MNHIAQTPQRRKRTSKTKAKTYVHHCHLFTWQIDRYLNVSSVAVRHG